MKLMGDKPPETPEDICSHIRVLCQSIFICKQCGNCCRTNDQIVIYDKDIANISKAMDLPIDTVLLKYVKFSRSGKSAYLKNTQPCAFLNDNICLIYDYRPFICRTFPFCAFGNQKEVVPLPQDCPGAIDVHNKMMQIQDSFLKHPKEVAEMRQFLIENKHVRDHLNKRIEDRLKSKFGVD